MSLKSQATDFIVNLLDDQRVQKWVDTRITNALNTQRDEIFGKIETSGASVINETKSAIDTTQNVLQGNINGLSQALAGATNSIVNNVVSQIKGFIPFHFLPGAKCPHCGRELKGE
jgi:phage-related protein